MGASQRRLLAVVCLALLLSGCWDRRELESSAYIIDLGVDRAPSGRLLITGRIALLAGLAPGVRGASMSAGERLSATILTAEGQTLTNALYIMNGSMSRRLDFRHMRAVLVGEELAREGVEPYVMELIRLPEVRQTASFVQCRGRATDVIQASRPVAEINPAKLEEDYLLQAKHLHMTPPTRLHHVVSRIAANGGDPMTAAAAINPGVEAGEMEPREGSTSALPGELPRGGGNPVGRVGTAIFRRDKLRGFVNVDQTQMLLAMRGEMGKACLTMPDPYEPEAAITIRLHQENLPQLRHGFRGQKPWVQERLLFEAEVLAVPSGVNYVAPPARERLEEHIRAFVERAGREVLDQLQEWEADPIGYGHLFRSNFPPSRPGKPTTGGSTAATSTSRSRRMCVSGGMGSTRVRTVSRGGDASCRTGIGWSPSSSGSAWLGTKSTPDGRRGRRAVGWPWPGPCCWRGRVWRCLWCWLCSVGSVGRPLPPGSPGAGAGALAYWLLASGGGSFLRRALG